MVAFPLVGDAVNIGGTGFIIKYLDVSGESACLHAFHDGIVCGGWCVSALDLKGSMKIALAPT